jgi:hypothetical protein
LYRRKCVALHYQKGNHASKGPGAEQGESITKWAKREAQYRRKKTAPDTRHEVPEAKRAMNSEATEGELPVMRPSDQRYRMLQKWAKKGVLLVEPKDNGRTLAVTVTELATLTVDEVKRRPDKVRAAIQKTLDKAVQKAAEKPPATPLVPRRVFDARRPNSPGPHPKVLSKSVGQAPRKELSVAKDIETPRP